MVSKIERAVGEIWKPQHNFSILRPLLGEGGTML